MACHRQDQTGHYYLIESAACEVLVLRFPGLTHLANNLFTEKRRSNVMSKLRGHRPFANIAPCYENDEVACVVITPKNCLKPSCEEYSTMEVSELN